MTTIIRIKGSWGNDHNNKDDKVLGVMATIIKIKRFLG